MKIKETTLINRGLYLSRKRMITLNTIFLMTPIALLITVILILSEATGKTFKENAVILYQELPGSFAEQTEFWLTLFIFIPAYCIYLLAAYYSHKRERLKITSDGIEYISLLPKPLRWLRPDWVLRWHEIKHAKTSCRFSQFTPETCRIDLYYDGGVKHITPHYWSHADDLFPLFKLKRFTRYSVDEFLEQFKRYAVVQQIMQMLPERFDINSFQDKNNIFALEKNPHTIAYMVFLSALIIYAAVDFVLFEEAYSEDPYAHLPIFIVLALLLTFLSALYLIANKVPTGESLILAMLLGIVTVFTSPIIVLRINALTDSQGLFLHHYEVNVSKHNVTLLSHDSQIPDINYFAPHRYWQQHNARKDYPVYIRKGGLEIHQFNLTLIKDEIKNYRETND